MLDEFENETDNLKYRSLFKDYFNLATLPFYWDTLEPDMGCPRYDKNSKKIYRRPSPDLCMEYCKENNIAPKLHCLVYDKFVPSWLVNKPLEEVKFFYEKRFKEIAERYGKDLFEVEVTNEILQEYWWRYKTALSEEKDIAEWSFNLARKYFKNNTLVINDGEQLTDIARKDYRQ